MGDDHFLQNIKQTFSLSDLDHTIELLNHFPGPNPYLHSLLEFPKDNNFFEGPGNLENFPGLFIVPDENTSANSFAEPVNLNESGHNDRKMEAIITSSSNSSPRVSYNAIKKTHRVGRGKKVKPNEEEDEKPREVVHVRAKRGQATDSHSLAERVRRRKINERFRCLQDIVPGCHKTMGMAVMLDEIINYVHSLQNQVEFLSMRLTATSPINDFNSDTETMEETIQRAKTFEALHFQNIANQGLNFAEFSPLGLNFGYCPQLPDNS